MKIDMKELSYYKNLGRVLGGSNKIICNLPPHYGYGHIAEVAAMAILGRIQQDLKVRNVNFYIEAKWFHDINGGFDMSINANPIQLKSKYTYQERHDYENCILEYDSPGIINLNNILNYVSLWFHFEKNVIHDINYIWSMYMKFYGIIPNISKASYAN